MIRWFACSFVPANQRPSVWCSKHYFFIISHRLRALKTFWNNFCKEFCKKWWKKNNTRNIRRLVNESFVPSNQQTSVLYCRLSDFNWRHCLFNKYVPTLYNGDLFYVDSFPHQEKGTIIFCFYNFSDLLRENLFE